MTLQASLFSCVSLRFNVKLMMFIACLLGQANIICRAEYFSSVESLLRLTEVESGLAKNFREYLAMQEDEFSSYRRFIENVKAQHKQALEDVEDYLGNPINAFTLIKRMVTDWTHLHEYIKAGYAKTSLGRMLQEFNQKQMIPDDEELKGAVRGIARLQRIYNLNAFDLANGVINGVDYETVLSWHDCFEIAALLFNEKEFEMALPWFEITLEKLDATDNEQKDIIERKFYLETLEYLALANYELGKSERALEYIAEILELEPDHHTRDLDVYIRNSAPKEPQTVWFGQFPWFANYSRLCQGIKIPNKELDRKLKCILLKSRKPSFILSPLKVEQLLLDPAINLYHGVLTDGQIERIREEASQLDLHRSTVRHGNGSAVRDVRVSQQVWLNYTSPVMRTVYRLVEDITNLDLRNSETMQVANYGIGGQYDPHHDFLRLPDIRWPGDRIATNMFYLSDVEQGGYTAFPMINTFSSPVKGALVQWHNLHKSLDPDFRTLHAGCPVLKGSKRIANIWVHSGFQEFRRPCDLVSDTHLSAAYVG